MGELLLTKVQWRFTGRGCRGAARIEAGASALWALWKRSCSATSRLLQNPTVWRVANVQHQVEEP